MILNCRAPIQPGFVDIAGLSVPVFRFNTVVVGTGCAGYNAADTLHALGQTALYWSSVYPESQTCATGTALEAGARGVNLTESQYGIASVKFRWNLSGTYQQVVPTYVSTDRDGGDAREFLDGFFESPWGMMDAIFLKGYQWPFDPRKLGRGGSSLVDIAVFRETQSGRRVFLDFRVNPSRGGDADGLHWNRLSDETFGYLERSEALLPTPIERLVKMNPLAYKLYLDNGIDLKTERLEIAVCAQHNNGGLAVNEWWESNLKNLFPVGEVAGSLGVTRPGGSALNSTQVGSTRAAQFIAANRAEAPMPTEALSRVAAPKVEELLALMRQLSGAGEGRRQNPFALRAGYQREMDACGAFIRPKGKVEEALASARKRLAAFADETRAESATELVAALINRDVLIARIAFLSAIREFIDRGGKSRGSYLICDSIEDLRLENAPVGLDVALDDGRFSNRTCEVAFDPETLSCAFDWKDVRPIPNDDDWFENVWNAYVRGEVVR